MRLYADTGDPVELVPAMYQCEFLTTLFSEIQRLKKELLRREHNTRKDTELELIASGFPHTHMSHNRNDKTHPEWCFRGIGMPQWGCLPGNIHEQTRVVSQSIFFFFEKS